MYADKKGTYKVSFDLCNQKNQKISSHSVKVYAYSDSPFKSVTYDGAKIDPDSIYQTIGIVSNKEKGKFSVKMNDGYVLSEITAFTEDKNNQSVQAKIKNNSIVSLGKYQYQFESGSLDGEYSMDDNMFASTTFNYAEYGECSSIIGLYAEKNGEYVVMFDVCDSSGKKLGYYEVKFMLIRILLSNRCHLRERT